MRVFQLAQHSKVYIRSCRSEANRDWEVCPTLASIYQEKNKRRRLVD